MIEIFYSVCLIILNVGIYIRTLHYDVVMDDFQWWQQRRTKGFRKLDLKSWDGIRFWIEERLYGGTTFGLNLKVEHCVTIVLYTLTCLLIYWVLGHNKVSFWAAFLYSCNPINNQTSCWLNGRRYSLNIVFTLLMMIFPLSIFVLYPLTGILQVTAIFSPVLLFNSSPWYLISIPVAMALFYRSIKMKCDLRASAMANGDLRQFKITRLIVVVKTFGFFFWKMLFPGLCAMQYPDRIKWGLTERGNKDAYSINMDFVYGILAIMVCIGVLCCLPSSYWSLAVFMILATLQWSAILPITQILSDRYCSMPNVFMMFFVSYFLSKTGIFYIPLMTLLGCYYFICLSTVMPMYKDLTDWYQYHFKYFPGLSWYRHNLITDLMNEGKRDMALQQTIEGLHYDKKDFRLLMWGAIMSTTRGNLKEAEDFLKEAENNLYLNKEEDQRKEIAYLRDQIGKLRPIQAKAMKLTQKEKDLLMRKKGIKLN